jgi:hypothetical protein
MTTHYTHPSGSVAGNGQESNPVDLQTALSSAQILPNDELILLPGIYLPKVPQKMTSTLSSVVMRPQSLLLKDRAKIDFFNPTGNLHSNLTIVGSKSIWRNIEFYCSVNKPRITTGTGSWVAETDRLEIKNNGEENQFHGCIFRDFNNGLTSQHLAKGGLISGCYFYNNGWIGGDRPHGHGCYLQNDGTKKKTFRNNLVWNNYDDGIDVYGSAAPIHNIALLENTGIGNGKRNLVYTGETVIKDGLIEDNWLFQPPTSGVNGEDTLALSSPPQWTPVNESIALRRNMILGAIRFSQGFKATIVEDNKILGGRDARFIDLITVPGTTIIKSNQYFATSSSPAARFMIGSSVKTLSEWQSAGYDIVATINTTFPETYRYLPTEITDRLHLSIFNPQKKTEFQIDFANKWKYTIYSMYDLDAPVLSGEGNSAKIPMGAKSPQLPINALNPVAKNDLRFESFILELSPSGTLPPPIDPPPPLGETYEPMYVDQDGKFYSLQPDGKMRRL